MTIMNDGDAPKAARAIRTCFAGLAGLMMLSADAGAQLTKEAIAYTGQGADAASVFALFDDPIINDAGAVAFWAWTSIDSTLNDECAGAIEVFPGVTTMGNTAATTGTMPLWCGRFDVWFHYTPEQTGPVSFAFAEGSGTTNTRPAIAIYTGTCNTLAVVAEFCTSNPPALQLTAGTRYFIRVGWGPVPFPDRWTATLGIREGQPQGLQLVTYPRASRQKGLWRHREGFNELLVQQADPAEFDHERTFRSTYFAALGGDGTLVLPGVTRGAATVPEITRASLISIGGGPAAELFRDAPVEELPAARWLVPLAQVNADGRLAYTLNNGLELRAGTTVVSAGDAAPGTPKGTTFILMDAPVSSASSPFAFRAKLAGEGVTAANDMGIWADVGGGLVLVARAGDVAPGTSPTATWDQLAIEPAVSDAGQVAFHATLGGEGTGPENNSGIWASSSAGVALLARAGDDAPGVPGALFASFDRHVRVNRAGQVLVRAAVAGKGIDASNNTGLWLLEPGGSVMLAREGQSLTPSAPAVVFANFLDPVLDDFGNVFVSARVRGPAIDRYTNEAIMSLRSGSRRVIVQRGDAVELPTGDTKIVARAVFGDSGPGAGRSATSHAREMVYRLVFTDGSESIWRAVETCVADWDQNGAVDSNDFFAYLRDFFEGRGDLDGDGAVNSSDFFAFLERFFAGCD